MSTARGDATATLLVSSGEVLIAGGFGPGPGFQLLASTELYNAATNSFAPASGACASPNMNSAREAAAATLLPNGNVLIAGGIDGSGNPLASTELYNAATNSFAPASGTGAPPGMNAARGEATATLLVSSGKVLIAGGFGPNPTSTELYDAVANSFAPASPPYLNTAREDATATLLPNGKVLIAGGVGPGGLLASTELYDPVANSFAPAPGTGAPPSMNSVREDATATLLPNGRVLIAGGYDNSGNALASTESVRPGRQQFRARFGDWRSAHDERGASACHRDAAAQRHGPDRRGVWPARGNQQHGTVRSGRQQFRACFGNRRSAQHEYGAWGSRRDAAAQRQSSDRGRRR